MLEVRVTEVGDERAGGLSPARDASVGSGLDTLIHREDSMARRLVVMVLMFVVVALGGGVGVLAHEGHEHKVMGTVTMAMADHIALKDKEGKEVTIKVTKDTKVKAKPAIKVEDIKVGTRVVVTAVQEKDKSMTAKAIEVGVAPTSTK